MTPGPAPDVGTPPRALLDALDEGVVLHALDGTIVGCNAAAARLLGASEGCLVGHASLFPLLAAQTLDGVPLAPADEPAWQLLLGGRDASPCRVRLCGPDGESRLELRAVRLTAPDAAGVAPCAATLVRDVGVAPGGAPGGEVRDLEAAGLLAASVAHDFNNLLTVILGYSEMLGTHPAADAGERQAVREVQRAAELGARLSRQLLAVARGVRLEREHVEVDGALRDMRAVFARVLGGTRRLELALDSGGARVGIERARLEQALLHVLENARDATAADGCVRVETRLVELEPGFVARHAGTRGGRHVRVEVRDDGAALSPNEAAHAFDAFRGTRGGGGIGLALVRGIVGASDGCVEATSEPGRGVAIRLYLPVTAAAGAPAAAREVDSG